MTPVNCIYNYILSIDLILHKNVYDNVNLNKYTKVKILW